MNNELIKEREVTTEVKGIKIKFTEKYKVDAKTNEEIFDIDIEQENDVRLYNIYKKRMNLLTTNEIKEIRERYGLSQKDFALALGMGEITINRLENGSTQSGAVDSIIRLSENPENMLELIERNR
jgi:putative zinc finger/helix-turn-helix YgiT family protein